MYVHTYIIDFPSVFHEVVELRLLVGGIGLVDLASAGTNLKHILMIKLTFNFI